MNILDLYKETVGINKSLSLTPYQRPYFIVNPDIEESEDNE